MSRPTLLTGLTMSLIFLLVPLMPEQEIGEWARKDYCLTICAVLIILALSQRQGARRISLRSSIDLPLLGLIAWSALSLLWSADRFNGLVEWLRLSSAVVFFYGAVYLSRSRVTVAWLGLPLGIGAAGAALQGFWQVSRTGAPRAVGVFTNPNYLASYLCLAGFFLLPFLCGYLLRPREKGRSRPSWLELLAILALFVLLIGGWSFARSRGSLLGTVPACLFLLAYFWPEISRGLRRSRTMVACLGIGLVVAALAFGWPVLQRISRIDADHLSSARIFIWFSSIKMALAHPVAGVGLGSFRAYYPGFKEAVLWMNDARFAHSEYLQAWCELGAVGLGLVVAVAAGIIRSILALHAKGDRLYVGALSAGGAAVLVQAMVDFNLHSSGTLFILPLIAGWTVGRIPVKSPRDRADWRWAGALLVVALLLVSSRHFLATRDYLRGHQLMSNGRIPAALRCFQAATSHPFLAGAENGLASCQRLLGAASEQVELHFAKAIAAAPRETLFRENYYHYLRELGRNQQALAQLRAACQLRPVNPLLRGVLADYLLVLGYARESLVEVEKVLSIETYLPAAYETGIQACLLLGKDNQAADYKRRLAAIRQEIEDREK
jgi:O-antigen ligase